MPNRLHHRAPCQHKFKTAQINYSPGNKSQLRRRVCPIPNWRRAHPTSAYNASIKDGHHFVQRVDVQTPAEEIAARTDGLAVACKTSTRNAALCRRFARSGGQTRRHSHPCLRAKRIAHRDNEALGQRASTADRRDTRSDAVQTMVTVALALAHSGVGVELSRSGTQSESVLTKPKVMPQWPHFKTAVQVAGQVANRQPPLWIRCAPSHPR